jgi:Tol biopolymer transport system component/DNA-binding winged helix-turn-helix (wHTH) protein
MLLGTNDSYQFGPFRIGVAERVLRRQDQIVPLTPKCFDTLLVLAQHGGNVVEKETLMRAVWPDSFVEEGNLAQNIFTLRKTLGELPEGGRYIQTIPKRGYRLVVPEAAAPAPVLPQSAPPPEATHRAPRRISYVIAAGIAIASTLIAGLLAWSPANRSVPVPRISLLTVPNNIAYGIVSPDGRHIAYVSRDAELQSLWVRETAGVGAGTRVVGPLRGHFWGVSYSPDTEYLYYVLREETHPTNGVLFRVAVRGGESQRLASGVAAAPAFSPDGRRLVFKRYEPNDRGYLLTANALGGDIRIIAQRDAAYAFYNYQWAADGMSVYFVEGVRYPTGSGWSLWEIPAAGGAARLVMGPQPKPLSSVNWLSRSEVLALIADEDSGREQIWRLGPGTAARRLTNDINNYTQIGHTEDGRTLLANTVETHDSIWTAAAPGLRRTEPVRLSLPAGSYDDPAWTPDGRVVFAGQSNLWLSSADGVERKPLLPEKGVAMEPAISSDGRFVVFVLRRQGSTNLWRIGIDGSGFRRVTGGRFDWHPALSPDGKWVAYVSRVLDQTAVWKAPLDGAGSPVKLVASGVSELVVSPDGRLLAYTTDSGETQLRSFDDGSMVRKMTAPVDAAYLQWSRDGKSLTYVSHSDRSEQFWREPIAGGPAIRIGQPMPGDVLNVNWSSDASRILYLRREIKVDLALLTNLR